MPPSTSTAAALFAQLYWRPAVLATRNDSSPPSSDQPTHPAGDDPTVTMWEFLHSDRWTMPSEGGFRTHKATVPLRKPPKYEVMLPQIVEMTEAGSGVDLISRVLGVGTEVVREGR